MKLKNKRVQVICTVMFPGHSQLASMPLTNVYTCLNKTYTINVSLLASSDVNIFLQNL